MGATNTTVRKGVYKNLISTKELANEIFETGVTSQQFKLKKDVMKKVYYRYKILYCPLLFE